MSKQSLSAVPPDIAKPEVLKRFLTRLLEQLDTILGLRGTGQEKYVSQQDLASAAETLSSLQSELSTSVRRFQQLRKDLEVLNLSADQVLDRVKALELELTSLDTFATTQVWLKMFEADFIGRNTNGPASTTRSFNVTAVVRVGTGRYDITLDTDTFLGVGANANTKVLIEPLIAAVGTSGLFTVEYKWNSGTLELYVFQHTISGTSIIKTAVDPVTAGDSIRVSGLMARPSAGVPA